MVRLFSFWDLSFLGLLWIPRPGQLEQKLAPVIPIIIPGGAIHHHIPLAAASVD